MSSFAIGILLMCMIVIGLTAVGNCIARTLWMPKIIESQRELFQSSQFIIEHDGWREDQLSNKEIIQTKDIFKQKNYETANDRLEQIEKLLEMPKTDGDLKERLERLKPYFKNT